MRDKVYKKSKARSADRAFLWATTGLALCLMQFLQTVCTTFGNTFGVGAFVGLFSTAFDQAFLFEPITTTFGDSVTFQQAISTAGGVPFEALDEHLMLKQLPGVFCAGEMLDWEAPTGGYLLTGCFASGRAAGRGMVEWLRR